MLRAAGPTRLQAAALPSPACKLAAGALPPAALHVLSAPRQFSPTARGTSVPWNSAVVLQSPESIQWSRGTEALDTDAAVAVAAGWGADLLGTLGCAAPGRSGNLRPCQDPTRGRGHSACSERHGQAHQTLASRWQGAGHMLLRRRCMPPARCGGALHCLLAAVVGVHWLAVCTYRITLNLNSHRNELQQAGDMLVWW